MMDIAIGIIKREIQIRLSLNDDKTKLSYQIVKLEIESLNKALEVVKKSNDIHNVSDGILFELPKDYKPLKDSDLFDKKDMFPI